MNGHLRYHSDLPCEKCNEQLLGYTCLLCGEICPNCHIGEHYDGEDK